MRKRKDYFTPYRQHLFDIMTLCPWVVPGTIAASVKAPDFFKMTLMTNRTAYLVQAVSRTLKQHPRVNAGFVRDFWKRKSRLVRWDTVDASLHVDREFDGERFPFFYVIRNSDRLTVKEIGEQIEYVTRAPVHEIKEFAGLQKLLQLPRFLRKLYYKRMICDEDLMREKIGTFSLTNLTRWGAEFRSISTIAPRLMVAVVTDKASELIRINYLCNHVIVDGAQIGEFHQDLSVFLKNCHFE
ncbi:MAG: hypothetical protein HY391_02970 [Deltaproteobacteria bacterium]|nr:hypothetical protein [Deltaproteobacteria bacterium]